MIRIDAKQNCSGCTACMAICSYNAINMVSDEQGFKYPKVDLQKCVNCSLCNRICVFGKGEQQPEYRFVYAVQHKERSVLSQSTSGGIFTALSDCVLQNGGVVYGAAFDSTIVVRHIRATTTKDRDRMRGSKYVQSDLGDVFIQVKNDLTENKMVLFSGTPCQVAGLKSFLNRKYDNLICVDLICHGVPSPMIFKEHIDFLSKKYSTRILDYKFRPKNWGWHIHREMICGTKKSYYSTPYTDLWRDLYYSRIVTRPSCNNCSYSNLNRVGDISIGDCRGIDNVRPDFGSYEGVTLAIVNNLKGKKIFEDISDAIKYESLNIDEVMQPPLRQSSQPNSASKQFFSFFHRYGYKKTITLWFGRLYPLKYYVKKWIRRN